MEKGFIITIDGPTGAGKSTVGKILAKRMKLPYLDTGAMYRVVAYEAKNRGIEPDDEDALQSLCAELTISFKQGNGLRVFSSGKDVTDAIRTPQISMLASRVSAVKPVREALITLQRRIGSRQGGVIDGRDAGTVIFPDARIKFYLDAALHIRSKRRYKELLEKKIKVDYSDVICSIEKRDRDDSSRDISPLKPAHDAIIINTTKMTIEEVVEKMMQTIMQQSSSLP